MESDKLVHFLTAFKDALNAMKPGWLSRDGLIYGPDHAVIRLTELHDLGSAQHVDVEFTIDETQPNSPRLWDCVSGFGSTINECAKSAAHLWASTSGVALLEMKFSLTGAYADHFRGHEPQGLIGWHSICSAVIGYGCGSSAELLQAWWLKNQTVLPALSPFLSDLSDDGPHGIKIFFGAHDIAEVRIDGDIHESASSALLRLDWPRMEPSGFLRVFVIALHRE